MESPLALDGQVRRLLKFVVNGSGNDAEDQPATPQSGSASRPGAGMSARAILPLAYAQLHAAARRLMSGERADHTLQSTALVSEAYASLAKALGTTWPGPREFYPAAAQAMQHILIDHARKHDALSRGRGWRRVPLDSVDLAGADDCARIVSLDGVIMRRFSLGERASSSSGGGVQALGVNIDA